MAYYSNIFVPGVKYSRTMKVSFGAKPTEDIKNEEIVTATEKNKFTADTAPSTGLLQEAIRLHDAGAIGNDKEAVVKAHDLLKKLSRANPGDPVINAYYGSAITLMARDGSDPVKRMKGVKKGLGILDGVVRNASDNIQARILRGNVCYRLPETMFRRNSTAVEDFNYLINRYEQNSSVFSRDFYLQLLDNLSGAYKNLGKTEESKSVQEKRQNIDGVKPLVQDTVVKKVTKQDAIAKTAGASDQLSKIPAEILAHIPSNFLDNLPLNVREQLNTLLQNNPGSPSGHGVVEESPTVPPEERARLIDEGKKLYAKAQNGSRQDRLKAFNFLREAYETIPADNTIGAYYADCLIAIGLESNDMGAMFPNLFKGMKILNKAVEGEPDNIELRFLRGYLAFRLPEAFFHRTATAKEDLEYLVRRFEEDNSVFSTQTYWQVLYDLALIYRRLNMAETLSGTLEKLQACDGELFNQMADIGKRIGSCEYNRVHPLQEFFFIS
jgi:CII-binding regulator of phage lambda lysogenization HflD